MSLFRPMNSAESNLFTIRTSFGKGSSLDNFNNLDDNYVLASNNSNIAVTRDYLSSPANNNLPSNFVLEYDNTTKTFKVTYGINFTQHPSITISPHLSIGSFAIHTIKKNALTESSNNLEINFLDISGDVISPSLDGLVGLLGFDLVITGPIKIGITTGNSNKGWAITDNNGIYSFMDMNLGGGNIQQNSIIISKNLKLLSSNGNTKSFNSNTITTEDYGNTVWELNNVDLTNITPQKGMFLIIYRNGLSNSSIRLSNNCFFNFNNNINTLTFESNFASVILYSPNITTFIIVNQQGTVTSSLIA